MSPLYTLSYYSECLIPEEQRRSEMAKIVSVATRNNAVRYVSGLLTLQGDYFMQVLEGSQVEIFKTFEAIKRDRRHQNIEIVALRKIKTRRFARWVFGHAGRTVEAQDYFESWGPKFDDLTHEDVTRNLERLMDIDRKYTIRPAQGELARCVFM